MIQGAIMYLNYYLLNIISESLTALLCRYAFIIATIVSFVVNKQTSSTFIFIPYLCAP